MCRQCGAAKLIGDLQQNNQGGLPKEDRQVIHSSCECFDILAHDNAT